MSDQRRTTLSRLTVVIGVTSIIAALIGIGFRFYGLDTKFYFQDEAITSLITGGHTKQAFIDRMYDGQAHSSEQIRDFDAQTDSSARATVASLATSDTLHPPLFYVIEHFWTRWFGTSIVMRRLSAAIFGGVAVIAIYWLAFELFGEILPALMACALLALSPVQVLYSQQAREYSLFALFIVVAATIFLRAMKVNRWPHWLVLAIVGALGLYTFPTFGFLLFSFAFVALAMDGWRLNRTRALPCFIAVAASFASYSPWIVQILHRSQSLGAKSYASPISTAYKLFVDSGAAFFDLEYANIRLMPVLVIVVGLVAIALFRMTKSAPPMAKLLLWSMIASVCILLLFPDTVGHSGHSSFEIRYAMSAWIAIVLSAAFAFGFGLTETNVGQRAFLVGAYALLLTASVASDAVSAKRAFWYPTNHEVALGAVVDTLNADTKPLLVSVAPEHDWDYILAISNYTGPNVTFGLAYSQQSIRSALSQGYDVYVLADPRSADFAAISKYAKVEQIPSTINPPSAMTDPRDAYLWQVKQRAAGPSTSPWLYKLSD